MKNKLLLIVMLSLLIVGCSPKKEVKVEANKIIDKDIKEKEEKVYADPNPIKLALYVDKKKTDKYLSPMTIGKDIVSLECYYTEDNTIINGKFKEVFNHYYNNYQNIDEYKIGYHIKFNTTTDGEFDMYIYRPRDTYSLFNHIQVYLYDDIHPETAIYSHVTDEEYNDKTLLTSIKLTASKYMDRVNSDIEVEAFTYRSEDINSNKEYVGKNKYKTIISRE